MIKSRMKKLSIIALSLSLATTLAVAAAKKDGQPKRNKAGAKAKKADAGQKANRRKGAGQAAQVKAVKDLVDELATELDLTDAQKTKAEQIVKKHMRTITARRGRGAAQDKAKAPGAENKGKGKPKRGAKKGGKKKDKDAAKPNDGPEIDRF